MAPRPRHEFATRKLLFAARFPGAALEEASPEQLAALKAQWDECEAVYKCRMAEWELANPEAVAQRRAANEARGNREKEARFNRNVLRVLGLAMEAARARLPVEDADNKDEFVRKVLRVVTDAVDKLI